jgi:hypothetical protein
MQTRPGAGRSGVLRDSGGRREDGDRAGAVRQRLSPPSPAARNQGMTTRSAYRSIVRTYARRKRSLVALAALVFVPLGLLHALALEVDGGAVDLSGVGIGALAAALAVLSGIGLLGEVFYAGAVANQLSRSDGRDPPPLAEIASMIDYRRLIAVDLIFAAVVSIGFVAFVVPGVLAFVYLGLCAPVVELERRGVWESLLRSVHLVRRRFWLVFAVLVPVEVVGDGLTDLVTAGVHALAGGSLLAVWLADSASNIAVTPFYAVAAVILTLELIAEKDAEARLDSGAPGA